MLKFNLPPKKKFYLKLYVVYLIPLITGFFARFYFFKEWINSPFRYYHTLTGLDMKTLLLKGGDFYNGNAAFSPYKLFIAGIYWLTDKNILSESVVLGQFILGMLSIVLTVFISLSISGRKSIAFISGIFMALYAPIIIYETQILKATIYLFLSLLSLAVLLFARKKNFSKITSFLTGVTACLPFFVRHAGFLWLVVAMTWLALYCYSKYAKKTDSGLKGMDFLQFKPFIWFICGSLAVFILVFAINKKNGFDTTSYFLPNFNYLINTGADPNGDISEQADVMGPKKTESPSPSVKASRTLKTIAHYAVKAYYIFNNYEMPNNINYYFIQKKLPISKFLIGPALLMPLALTGMILLIIYGCALRKESILFFYIFAFAIPICIFLPLGRYKLVLAPIFCITAAYAFYYLFQIFNRQGTKLNNLLVPLFMIFFLFLSISTTSYPLRNSDEKAYGLAAIYFPDKLMQKGKFKEASQILKKYYGENQENSIISLYYASSLLGCNRPKDAEFILKQMNITKDSIGHYFYVLGECYRMQGRKQEADQCYTRVLNSDCLPILKKMAKHQKSIIMK